MELRISKDDVKNLTHFETFCAKYVKIRGFDGQLIPFVLNRGQRRLWKVIKKDLEENGKCDLVMVKARKGGFTTFFVILSLWLAITNVGVYNLLGVHHKSLLSPVSDIVNIAYDNLPKKLFSLTLGRDQTTDKSFTNLNSGVKVIVVSNTSKVGRGETPTAIIVTEVAHIDKAYQLEAGLLSANSDVKGAIRVLETTANGTGNYHYTTYMGAKAGTNSWIAFFSPWYENDRYRKEPPLSYVMTDDDIKAKDRLNLEMDQVYWRHCKLKDMDPDLFKQEFPENDEEAFSFSGFECYIPVDKVVEAIKRPMYHVSAINNVAAYDPSPTPNGDDKAYIERSGRNFFGLEYPKLKNHIEEANWLACKLNARDLNNRYIIDKLYIDAGSGGGGYAVFDLLEAKGFKDRIFLVDSAGAADEPHKYYNKRAEMIDRLKDGFTDKVYPFSINVEEKLQEKFKIELTCFGAMIRNGLLLIDPKDKIKKNIGYSPGGLDVAGMTMADIEADISEWESKIKTVRMVHVEDNDSLLAEV